MFKTVLVEVKGRKIVTAGKSHFGEYCPSRLSTADNTDSKNRLPPLVLFDTLVCPCSQ